MRVYRATSRVRINIRRKQGTGYEASKKGAARTETAPSFPPPMRRKTSIRGSVVVHTGA